jgi:hypothetical protein
MNEWKFGWKFGCLKVSKQARKKVRTKDCMHWYCWYCIKNSVGKLKNSVVYKIVHVLKNVKFVFILCY